MAIDHGWKRVEHCTMADYRTADAAGKRRIEQHWKQVWDRYQRQRLSPRITAAEKGVQS